MSRDVEQKALALSALLRDAPLFAGLTQQGFLGLTSVLHERRLQRGEVLFHRGNPGISLVIVGQGQLGVQTDREAPKAPRSIDREAPKAPRSIDREAPKASRSTDRAAGGPEAGVEHLGPGAVTGEMSCIDPAPRSATVVATQDSLVYELTRPALHGLYQSTPQAAVTIVGAAIGLLICRLRETNRRITDVLAPVLAGGAQGGGSTPGATGGQGTGAQEAAPGAGVSLGARAQPVPHRGPLDLSSLQAERGLTDADVRVLLQVAPPMRYPGGALLCREGEPASSCFIVGSGWVEVLRQAGDEQRVVAATGPGAMLGHLALVDAGRRPATVRSREGVVGLELLRDDFAHLLRDLSPLAMRLQEQVAIAAIRQLRMAIRHLDTALLAAGGQGGQADPPSPEALRALRGVLHEWYPMTPQRE